MAALLDEFAPTHAVVDLKLAGGASGLSSVRRLHDADPGMVIVVLTGYASIATAVEAIKLGARRYLAKPSNTDDIEAAFQRAVGDADVELSARTTSIKTLEWEHIHEALAASDFNISETARRLGLHRRTLARKLEKRRVNQGLPGQVFTTRAHERIRRPPSIGRTARCRVSRIHGRCARVWRRAFDARAEGRGKR